MMDICILAGGYGTRLEGIWDKPKCLIPYRGRPLIEFLVNQALELQPRKVFLLLGHKASQVVAWREDCCPHQDVVPIIETVPSGTASAIRYAFPHVVPPLMVLNGDTVPGYDLDKIANDNDYSIGRGTVAWANSQYAGTALFSSYGLRLITTSEKSDLDEFVNYPINKRIPVLGFLDVGTPEGFRQVQTL